MTVYTDWLAGASTASTASPSTLTLNDILKAVETLKSLPPEPFAQWMRESGKPPEDGYELHLPIHVKDHFPFAPDYVKFSRAVHTPIIVPSFNTRTFNYD